MHSSEQRHLEYIKRKMPQTTRCRMVENPRDANFLQNAQKLQMSIEKSRERRMGHLSKGVEWISRHLTVWEERRHSQ